MKKAHPTQAYLTKTNDLSKTAETEELIDKMVEALNKHEIDTMGAYFAENFCWIGNAGCGVKQGLKEFQDNWQRPFQAAFSDKTAIDEARLVQGEWAASFGRQEAVHTGTFMGIAPTGKRVEIRYMDFWKVQNGKIVTNWVMVDFPYVLRQLGVDVFDGQGWDKHDKITQPVQNGNPISVEESK
ncbi:MAG: ester cyclase [Alphaproteobacteria bacterium]|nr:ester cyclase [Alphaproteobacteria bacterium]MDD9841406.1 ester cyclase [Alphaproteobacteria bacterium]